MRSALILGSLAAALLVPAEAAARTPPTLRVVASTPLTLRGTSFRPREAVRITVLIGTSRLSRQLRAGPLGGFTVRFPGVRLDYCAIPLVVSARGTATGLVRARLPIVDCAMP